MTTFDVTPEAKQRIISHCEEQIQALMQKAHEIQEEAAQEIRELQDLASGFEETIKFWRGE